MPKPRTVDAVAAAGTTHGRTRQRGGPISPKKALKTALEGPPFVQRAAGLGFGIGPAVRKLYRHWFLWRYDQSLKPQMRAARAVWTQDRPSLDGRLQTLVESLKTRGIASARFEDLWQGEELDEVVQAARNWSASDETRRIEAEYISGETRKWKEYLVRMFDRGAVIDADNRWLRLGISPRVLSVVNEYLGLAGRLTYLDVWHTIALRHDGPDTGSQRWHRDPEDRRLVKVFLYLSDVDEGSGAMEYVPNSRTGDRYGRLWPQEFPGGSVPPTEDLETRLPSSARMRLIGRVGDVYFVDTSGLHRGGRATEHTRLLATWTYVTPASPWGRAFTLRTTPRFENGSQRSAIET